MGYHSTKELNELPIFSKARNYKDELLESFNKSMSVLSVFVSRGINACHLQNLVKEWVLEEKDLILGDVYFMDMYSYYLAGKTLDIVNKLRYNIVLDIKETHHDDNNYYLAVQLKDALNDTRIVMGHYDNFIEEVKEWQ